MIVSHVYRRALLLSIVAILGVSILAVGSLAFFHSPAQTSPGVVHHVAAKTIPGGNTVTSRNSTGRHGAAETTNEYASVPAWDAPAGDLAVFIREMHQGNWYTVNGIQSC